MAVEQDAEVVLLETKRSDSQGMAALRRLRAECPGTAVIVLTSYPDAQEQLEALHAGAVRYLLKEINSPSLVREIRAIAVPQAPI